MATTINSSIHSSEPHHLPSWIFDIVEEDQIDMQTPLLQELDIDVDYILRNIRWTLQSPWLFIFRYQNALIERFPSLQQQPNSSSSSSSSHSIDFWGPCFIISLYGAILWFAKVNNVPWLYIIWIISACIHHLVCRVWYEKSSLLLHLSLLGYSVTPVIPIAGIIVLVRKRFDQWLLVSILFQVLAVLLASTSAILSYWIVWNNNNNNNNRRDYYPQLGDNNNTIPDVMSNLNDSSRHAPASTHKAKLSGKEEGKPSKMNGNTETAQTTIVINNNNTTNNNRLPLLVPLILLMHLYVISLIPMNNH